MNILPKSATRVGVCGTLLWLPRHSAMPCAAIRSDLTVFTQIYGLKCSWRLHGISVTLISLVYI